MKIAVLSGKGGTGKTFVSVNMSASLLNTTYIDCDVEEPNGRLFFTPQNLIVKDVSVKIPSFNMDKCTGCRKCSEFCSFNAIAFIKGKPRLFTDVCHSCGGCNLVCSFGAITENDRLIGKVECGKSLNTNVVTGELNLGEASGVPVIKSALTTGLNMTENAIIDCPPGSSCAVMESITDADYCIIVTECTAFGFHNFQMVYELTKVLNKKCGVVINKWEDDYAPLNEFLAENNIPLLLKIPFLSSANCLISKGKILARENTEIKKMFVELADNIRGLIQ